MDKPSTFMDSSCITYGSVKPYGANTWDGTDYAATHKAVEHELNQAKNEADRLALYLWKRYYKDGSPNFELCDTAAGVISQIDNMVSGLSTQIAELEATVKQKDMYIACLEPELKYAKKRVCALADTIQDYRDSIK